MNDLELSTEQKIKLLDKIFDWFSSYPQAGKDCLSYVAGLPIEKLASMSDEDIIKSICNGLDY